MVGVYSYLFSYLADECNLKESEMRQDAWIIKWFALIIYILISPILWLADLEVKYRERRRKCEH